MTKEFTFEDILKQFHSDQYIGNDDDMADDYETWLGTLSQEEFILMGEHALAVERSRLYGF